MAELELDQIMSQQAVSRSHLAVLPDSVQHVALLVVAFQQFNAPQGGLRWVPSDLIRCWPYALTTCLEMARKDVCMQPS